MSKHVKECPVCLGSHESEIHAATLRVREWFRKRLQGWLAAPIEFETVEQPRADAA